MKHQSVVSAPRLFVYTSPDGLFSSRSSWIPAIPFQLSHWTTQQARPDISVSSPNLPFSLRSTRKTTRSGCCSYFRKWHTQPSLISRLCPRGFHQYSTLASELLCTQTSKSFLRRCWVFNGDYCILPCTRFLAQTFRNKIFCFNLLIQVFIYFHLDTCGFFCIIKAFYHLFFNIVWYKKFYVTNNYKTEEQIQGISGTTHV